MHAKKRIYEILEVAKENDRASRRADIFLMAVITLNVIAVIMESVASIESRFSALFRVFEIFSVALFSTEYLLRVWSCTSSPLYSGARGRIKFVLTPMAIIDLIAILPFYLPFLHADLRLFRAVRLFRLLRVVKMVRYSESLRTLGRVLANKKGELYIALLLLSTILLLASSIMYLAERKAQPANFSNIPQSMWWAVVTLTTVGYGDAYPITPLGRLIASVIAILGVGLFALPAGILASGFVEELHKKKEDIKTCPHCGKPLS